MPWDSFRFVARDLGVRYMMAPSRTPDPNLYLGGSFASYLGQLRGCVEGSTILPRCSGFTSRKLHSLNHFGSESIDSDFGSCHARSHLELRHYLLSSTDRSSHFFVQRGIDSLVANLKVSVIEKKRRARNSFLRLDVHQGGYVARCSARSGASKAEGGDAGFK